MELIDELFVSEQGVLNTQHEKEFDFIKLRCNELIKKYPEKKSLFQEYMLKQGEEYDTLETQITCLTMAIKRK